MPIQGFLMPRLQKVDMPWFELIERGNKNKTHWDPAKAEPVRKDRGQLEKLVVKARVVDGVMYDQWITNGVLGLVNQSHFI